MNAAIAGKQTNNVNQIDVSFDHIWIGDMLSICGKQTGLFENDSMDRSTNYFYSQLELIALQFLHQRPQFTACGFFTIDMTFIYAVTQS